jgi:DME family drug/metabolite transporter
MTLSPRDDAKPLRRTVLGDRWLIATSAILYGTVTVGGTLLYRAGFSLYEISLYPMVLTNLSCLPLLLMVPSYTPKTQMIPFFVVYGLIGALAELAQFGGIVLGVPVATVSLLLYSQPIWTSFFGKLLLHEPITIRKIVAIAAAVLGVLILTHPGARGRASARGLAFAIMGGVFVALWIIWGRKSGISAQHQVTTTVGWSAFSSLWLLALWPLFHLATKDETLSRLSFAFAPHYWLLLLTFAWCAGVLPSLLLFRGLKAVHASTAGVILLLEPLSACILGVFVLHQSLGLQTLQGGSLILFGNLVLSAEKSQAAG